MTLQPITTKQLHILLLLYKFRFLTSNQFQIIFNHKSISLINEWLKDLVDKGYIVSSYSRKIRSENTKPATFHLASPARHILKKEKDIEMAALHLIYKEKKMGKKFIDHCLTLADIYLFFKRQQKGNEELKFFTKTTLTKFTYFTDPVPDAYIVIKDSQGTRRYFLDLFDEYTPSFVYRKRIRQYLEYSRIGEWEANTNNSPLPQIYFVCPNETARKHVYYYGKSVIEKSFEEVTLFVTTKDTIKFAKENIDPWQKVE